MTIEELEIRIESLEERMRRMTDIANKLLIVSEEQHQSLLRMMILVDAMQDPSGPKEVGQ